MSDDITSREFWRRGHRRPWWQWNVLTLFAALFLLIWARELLRLPQTATWMICVLLILAWATIPAILLVDRHAKDEPHFPPHADVAKSNGVRPGYLAASAALFIAVGWVGGFFAAALSVIAAMVYAAATRSPRD